MRRLLGLITIAVVAGVGGASAEPAPTGSAAPSGPPVGAWPKPLILPFKLPPSGSSKDWTQLSIVGGKGLVGGTPEAVSSIGQPLAGLEGASPVRDACKKAVWDEASRSGAETIEAVSEGPDRHAKRGLTFAPVTMRVAYAKPNMVEVRKSTVICVLDRKGRFVDAYTPAVDQQTAEAATKPTSPTEWSRLGGSQPQR